MARDEVTECGGGFRCITLVGFGALMPIRRTVSGAPSSKLSTMVSPSMSSTTCTAVPGVGWAEGCDCDVGRRSKGCSRCRACGGRCCWLVAAAGGVGCWGGGPSRWRVVEVVRMADAFLSESGPITSVSELAAKLDISERWMRSAFQLAVGTSPKRYLRGHQLRGSRDELLKATPETSSVTEVALNWGFWYFSRFAESYRNLYDESPSDTLCRSSVS